LKPIPGANGYSAPVRSTTNTPSKPPTIASQVPASGTTTLPAPPLSITDPTTSKVEPIAQAEAKASGVGTTKTTDSPSTSAMRQIGIEAAQKAKDAKNAPKATSSASIDPPIALASQLSKLDNAGPTSMPPPTGTTEAADAIAPETGDADVISKADEVPSTKDKTAVATDTKGQESPLLAVADEEPPAAAGIPILSSETAIRSSSSIPSVDSKEREVTTHRHSSVSLVSAEEAKQLEDASKIEEEPEEDEKEATATTELDSKLETSEELSNDKVVASRTEIEDKDTETIGTISEPPATQAGTKMTESPPELQGSSEETKHADMLAGTSEEALPDIRTQEQEAASSDKAEESVAD